MIGKCIWADVFHAFCLAAILPAFKGLPLVFTLHRRLLNLLFLCILFTYQCLRGDKLRLLWVCTKLLRRNLRIIVKGWCRSHYCFGHQLIVEKGEGAQSNIHQCTPQIHPCPPWIHLCTPSIHLLPLKIHPSIPWIHHSPFHAQIPLYSPDIPLHAACPSFPRSTLEHSRSTLLHPRSSLSHPRSILEHPRPLPTLDLPLPTKDPLLHTVSSFIVWTAFIYYIFILFFVRDKVIIALYLQTFSVANGTKFTRHWFCLQHCRDNFWTLVWITRSYFIVKNSCSEIIFIAWLSRCVPD